MNRVNVSRAAYRRSRTRGATATIHARPVFLLAALLLVAGCADPLFYNPIDDPQALRQRLRNIEGFEPARYQSPDAPEPVAPGDVEFNESTVRDALDQLMTEPEGATELMLTLAECRAIALENNLDLKVQLLNPTIAAQSVSEAEAAFEATFVANLFWAKTDTPISTGLDGSSVEITNATAGVRIPVRTGGTISINLPVNETETDNAFAILNPSYTADTSVSISHNLLRNAGLRTNEHSIRVAYLGQRISESQTKLGVIAVLATVERVYWQVYAARRELEVRRDDVNLAISQLETARRRVAAELDAPVEEVRAESGVADTLEALLVARNSLADAQRNLKRILNMPDLPMDGDTVVLPATEPNPLRFELDENRLIEVALQTRSELLQTELQLLQDSSSVAFARNQLLPLLLLGYTYNVNGLGASYGDAFDVLRQRNFEDHQVSVQGEVPLGNEAAMSAYRRALLGRLQRIATKRQQTATITQEVLVSLDALETAWQRILASRLRTLLADRLYQAEQRQFELGLRNSTDVLLAQSNLTNARSAEIRALTDYQVSQVDIAEATGMLLGATRVRWGPDEPDIDRLADEPDANYRLRN